MQTVNVTQGVIDLLATTEGRDKLMKGLSAAMRVVGERTGADHHKKFASSLSEGRSLLRLAGATANAAKIRDLVSQKSMAPDDYVMVLRILGDAVYSINDNIAYLGKCLSWDAKGVQAAVERSFVGMFWGFFFACVADVYTLVTMDKTREDFQAKWRARVLLLTRNFCDMVVALSNVKYLKAVNLNPSQAGILGVISASISTYENWNKAVEKQAVKAVKSPGPKAE